MGASTSVVVALFFLGFLILGTTTYSAVDYFNTLVKNAQHVQDTMKKAKMQTDITIINVTNKTTYLNLTLKNTGKTTLNASALDVFYDGNYYTYNLLSAGNTWTSETNLNISINLVPQTNRRIKVVSESGVSDYAIVP
jgi:archaellum component FlaF (FlaF/FlaG flagellin family)